MLFAEQKIYVKTRMKIELKIEHKIFALQSTALTTELCLK